ncbi:MAG TPA: dienelactone hydrolase family protein [Bryobacteraceae bacterium]
MDLTSRLGEFEGMRWVAPGVDIGSWYPNRFWDPAESNEPFLTEAIERCDEAVTEASDDGRLGPEHLAVIGFSQGACLALEYARRHPGRCDTVIVFTGALLGTPGSHTTKPTRAGVHVLLTGSDADEWISEEATRETAAVLEGWNADLTLCVYPGRTHVVNDDEVAEARRLLDNL